MSRPGILAVAKLSPLYQEWLDKHFVLCHGWRLAGKRRAMSTCFKAGGASVEYAFAAGRIGLF